MRVVLGVGGGIAAYKVASLLRLFTEAGHNVTVIPTDAATRFVGTATWEALSGNPVSNSVFDDVDKVNHVRLGQQADLVVIAPATADLIARAAAGMANDLLTGTLLMARCPVLMAPAMHTEMWNHPATVANIATLRSRGTLVLDPASGRLTGTDSGAGRLPEPADIFAAAMAAYEGANQDRSSSGTAQGSLAGRHLVITAGGTREPIDPVRYLGNRSSGKQGMALAAAALAEGATVELIVAHVEVPAPDGVELVTVETAEQLRTATLRAAKQADALIMAAAVADFRPAEQVLTKIKKRADGVDPVITLVRNPDILREAVEQRGAAGTGPVIVGFAAETGDATSDPLDHARQKLARKGCDLLVLNQVGDGKVFGLDDTVATILDARGAEPVEVAGTKTDVAAAVVARVAAALAGRG
ncbi:MULTISPECIES: bifunctional phosphopantothenoylcysteine decarboxylase/phosphopantothenate--cysteine ligase CoaBC [unclassified Arthrobacter]|uniref:bifunctional phosphopantothenoylcysteine decarboxylase/phosphopantothenate--cysteine ligase CoaBC n=1 Tax=unclassified Arthrobacter TaxID=235627 RepID=UPI0014922DDC|nr:bifunctional phosphopantothenoylcysteine decarboxylase/phosphopantothenate--cysteine ligase CoaBC [Arthrobacter sp. AET 35A]MBE0009818.1 bifunctional phosphopantothenoylcysteine decarboxylase/phosphopantothenate--cysteine ligase CoaBC [Arthrobacter sp. AET 35A]NOJ63682.1 bifunctional phosphopantothenoylcysteine decarboxylase/phosphopantothenate--cysteine ligase CoaBC [Arthrobacter sp. 147(2020)]